MTYTYQNGVWAPKKQVVSGLGDAVSWVTKKLGIKECGGCSKRKAWLNKAVPFKTQERKWPGHPIAGGVDQGLEARGIEIQQQGGTVLCAERLDTNQFTTINNNTWTNPTDFNIVECSEVPSNPGTTLTGSWTQVSGSSVGVPQTSWVWGTNSGELKDAHATSSTWRRMSARYYTVISNSYTFGACGSAKWIQFTGGSGVPEFQGTDFTGPTNPGLRINAMTTGGGNWQITPQYNGGFSWNDCRASVGPCRVEVSFSCTGACTGWQGMTVDATVVPVAFAASQPTRRMVIPPTFVGSTAQGGSGIVVEAPNAFHTTTACGTRYFFYSAWAAWTTAAGQTIGAAPEIEGGVVGPPTILADPGAYVVTGSAMTPRSGRRITMNPGSYAHSGADVDPFHTQNKTRLRVRK